MKLKHRSIRVTFFAAISIIALVFIGILVLLNVFFYQDYYMMTRRSELRDAYGSICTSYASDSSDVAALLDSYESRSAIRLAVVTSSVWSNRSPDQRRRVNSISSVRNGKCLMHKTTRRRHTAGKPYGLSDPSE